MISIHYMSLLYLSKINTSKTMNMMKSVGYLWHVCQECQILNSLVNIYNVSFKTSLGINGDLPYSNQRTHFSLFLPGLRKNWKLTFMPFLLVCVALAVPPQMKVKVNNKQYCTAINNHTLAKTMTQKVCILHHILLPLVLTWSNIIWAFKKTAPPPYH